MISRPEADAGVVGAVVGRDAGVVGAVVGRDGEVRGRGGRASRCQGGARGHFRFCLMDDEIIHVLKTLLRIEIKHYIDLNKTENRT